MLKNFTSPGGIPFKAFNDCVFEYEAIVAGITFRIWKSTTGFGLSAEKKDSTKNLVYGGGIAWCGTRKCCAEYADTLLAQHGWKDRCPDCGAFVPDFFDHIDRDCTGLYPEKVAAGQLYAKDSVGL